MFSFVVAFGDDLSPYTVDHQKPHPAEPPVEAASVEMGQHIAQVCRGCHGEGLSGGKVAGDPNMPVVANLTPHETGLRGWTEADFLRAIREGKRKDGTDIKPQMPWQTYRQMNDVELKALWAYLQTVPAVAKGNHSIRGAVPRDPKRRCARRAADGLHRSRCTTAARHGTPTAGVQMRTRSRRYPTSFAARPEAPG